MLYPRFQSLQSRQHMFVFFEFSAVATYSLFPLLFRPTGVFLPLCAVFVLTSCCDLPSLPRAEAPLLLLLFATYHAFIVFFVEHSCTTSAPNSESHPRRESSTWSSMPMVHKIVCLSTLIVEVGRHALAHTSVGHKLPFLPLLLVSVFCAVGLLRVIFLQSRL